MVSKEQRDYLKLYKSIMDTGAEVVRMYIESKCKSKQGIDFATFMEREKHYFYHQWKMKRKKPFCCCCPPAGCHIPNTGNMNNRMFTKWYTISPNIQVPIGHMDALHFCICQHTARNLSIEEFDLSDLNFLLKNTKLLSQSDASQLEIISTVRNSVCHAARSNMFTENELKDLRSKFETATLQLTEQHNKRMVKMLLKTEPFLSNGDADKLMKEISDLRTDNSHNMYTVISTINHFTKILSCDMQQMKNEVVDRSLVVTADISQCTATMESRIQLAEERIQTSTTLLIQGQNELAGEITGSINGAQQQIRRDINENSKELHNCLNKTLEDTTLIKTEIKEMAKKIGVIEERFAAMTAFIEIYTQIKADTNANEQSRQVKMETKIESDVLNDDKTQTNLTSQTVPYTDECNSDDETIMVHSVKKNCILLETSASSNIFRNEEKLRSAIRTLIQKVLDAGEVDICTESAVKLSLRIITPLNDDETHIVQEMICKAESNNANQTACQEEQARKIDVASVQDKIGDIYRGYQASNVCAHCNELLEEVDTLRHIIYNQNVLIEDLSKKPIFTTISSSIPIPKPKQIYDDSDSRSYDSSYSSNRCSSDDKDFDSFSDNESEELQIPGPEIRYKTDQKETEPEEINPLQGKDAVDMFGWKYSLPSIDTYESENSKGDTYSINAGAVCIFQNSEVWPCKDMNQQYDKEKALNIGLSTKRSITTSESSIFVEPAETQPFTMKVLMSSENKTGSDETPSAFACIAKRFAEFQGFKFHDQINLSIDESVVIWHERILSTKIDCLVVLLPPIPPRDIYLIFRNALIRRGRPTVIIMQGEDSIDSEMISIIRRMQDCIVAVFTAQNEQVVAKLLCATMDQMKSGDDFASVLLDVSKKGANFNPLYPNVVISTLTKDLRFQKVETQSKF